MRQINRKIDPARAASQMIENYKIFMEMVHESSKVGLENAAKIVYDQASTQVPVQYGGLKASGRYEAEITSSGAKAHVSYGGNNYKVSPTPNAPQGIVFYAITVHETHPVNSGFLRTAANSTIKSQFDAFCREMRKVTK